MYSSLNKSKRVTTVDSMEYGEPLTLPEERQASVSVNSEFEVIEVRGSKLLKYICFCRLNHYSEEALLQRCTDHLNIGLSGLKLPISGGPDLCWYLFE